MELSSFDLFEQIEEYDNLYSGWFGNPAEETFPYENEGDYPYDV